MGWMLGEKRIAGLDEAGRGPVFGPLVLCGVVLDRDGLRRLAELGVRDSKLLSPSRRELLSREICAAAEKIEIVEISPEEIDRSRERDKTNLNELEAMRFAGIIEALNPDVAYVDAADPDPLMFENRIRRYLKGPRELVVENGADRKYTVVAAASIVAKVRRDARISELRGRYGDLGSGYPSDPKTISFLREWVLRHGDLPPFARRTWITAERLAQKKS